MCLEDLRLGRGRFFRNPQQIDPSGTATIPADATRVCVALFSSGSSSSGDSITVVLGTQISSASFFLVPIGGSITLLKIEELGQLVTQPMVFLINNNSGAAIATAVEICTEVNAPPLDTYKP